MKIPCTELTIKESDKLFFSESATKQAIAKSMCNSCDFKQQCLEQALKNNCEFGIFGGLTPTERKAMN